MIPSLSASNLRPLSMRPALPMARNTTHHEPVTIPSYHPNARYVINESIINIYFNEIPRGFSHFWDFKVLGVIGALVRLCIRNSYPSVFARSHTP